MFLKLLEFGSVFLFLLILITQVMIPMAFNKKTFPAFRQKQRDLENEITDGSQELSDTRSAIHAKELREQAASEREQASKQ